MSKWLISKTYEGIGIFVHVTGYMLSDSGSRKFFSLEELDQRLSERASSITRLNIMSSLLCLLQLVVGNWWRILWRVMRSLSG